jgi:hypothetical protein
MPVAGLTGRSGAWPLAASGELIRAVARTLARSVLGFARQPAEAPKAVDDQ